MFAGIEDLEKPHVLTGVASELLLHHIVHPPGIRYHILGGIVVKRCFYLQAVTVSGFIVASQQRHGLGTTHLHQSWQGGQGRLGIVEEGNEDALLAPVIPALRS